MKKGARLFGGIDMEIKHIQDHLMSVEEGYVRCFLIEGENAGARHRRRSGSGLAGNGGKTDVQAADFLINAQRSGSYGGVRRV